MREVIEQERTPPKQMERSMTKRSLLGGRVTWFFGSQGAHVRAPGWLYTRCEGPSGFSNSRTWRIFGIVCIRHNDTQGGTLKHCQKSGWSVKFATIKPKLNFRKADNYVS